MKPISCAALPRFARRAIVRHVGLALSLALPAIGAVAAGPGKSVPAGATWTVERTTRLSGLDIAPGARLQAPAQRSLTLTVDGVQTALQPGRYRGNVVLSVTRDIVVPFTTGPLKVAPYRFRTAVYVDDGRYVADRSVAAAAGPAQVGDDAARGLEVTSRDEDFNAIMVTGDSAYTINDAKIDLVGNGGNDFAGFGAAILSTGTARVTVNHAHIRTRGAIRTALFIGGKSTMTVNDSDIEVHDGALPAGYKFSILPGAMMEAPYGLGVTGNVRATNLIDNGTVYYNHSHIRTQGWGALSSDGDGPTRMFVTDCVVEAVDSGYGAFSNGDAHDHFSHTTLNVADYGIIMGGNGSATLTDASVINSGRIGVMMHQGTGGSVLTVDRKSVINSRSAAIEIKGRGADVVVDDAQLVPGNGVLLQAMDNDDPIMKEMMAGGPPGGPAGAPPAADLPGASNVGFSPDVNALIRNTALKGDVLHAMTRSGDMRVTLQHATLEGAISTSTTAPLSGAEPTRATWRTIGEVANTLGASRDPHRLQVTLDGRSTWRVTRTSYLDDLTLADGATLAAPTGYVAELTVDGVPTPIRPGAYKGRIVVRVVRA